MQVIVVKSPYARPPGSAWRRGLDDVPRPKATGRGVDESSLISISKFLYSEA